MDWANAALDAQFPTVRVLQTRTTSTGLVERLFEIELVDPDGGITVWSTDYEVNLLEEPSCPVYRRFQTLTALVWRDGTIPKRPMSERLLEFLATRWPEAVVDDEADGWMGFRDVFTTADEAIRHLSDVLGRIP